MISAGKCDLLGVQTNDAITGFEMHYRSTCILTYYQKLSWNIIAPWAGNAFPRPPRPPRPACIPLPAECFLSLHISLNVECQNLHEHLARVHQDPFELQLHGFVSMKVLHFHCWAS
jgi:hypothetical protein